MTTPLKGRRITRAEARQAEFDTMAEADRLRAEGRLRDRADVPTGGDAPPGDGWHVRYYVAALYLEGYGGSSGFDTEAEAIAHRVMLIEKGGYKVVDVWAQAMRWVVKEREDKP